MKLNQLFALICFLSAGYAFSQTEIYRQDFETENLGYSPSVTEGTPGDFEDIFNRSNPNIGGNSTFLFAIEDTNATPATVSLSQIDVTGFTSFDFDIDLLAHHYNNWDSTDELLITYTLDGGSPENLLWVQNTPASSAFNEPAALDTDFDGDGECTPATILPTLTTGTADNCSVPSGDDQFRTFSVDGIALNNNSTLSITITVNELTSTDEGIYFDNIVVTGNSGTPTNQAPSITNITTNPATPTDNDAINVSADISDTDGTISTAVLNWGTTSGSLTNSINMSVSSGATYQTNSAIQAQMNGTTVYYTVTATDDDSDSTTSTEMSYTLANQLPTITAVTVLPANPDSSDAVNISADITDSDGTISSATLNWGTTSGSLNNSITLNNTSGDTYQTVTAIPAQADGTTVFYTVTATDNDSDSTTTTEDSYTVTDPVAATIPYSIDFTSQNPFANNWTQQNVSGNEEWNLVNTEGVQMNAFNGGCQVNEDWLISPAFNLDNFDNELISFDLAETFNGTTLELLYSTDYTGAGDPNIATWIQIDTYDNGGTFNNIADLQGVAGTSVYISFKYEFVTGSCSQFTVENFAIDGTAVGANIAPVVSNIQATPAAPTSAENIVISADVTDSEGLASVTLDWGTASGTLSNSLTMSVTAGDEYAATIPMQADGTTVFYTVTAVDNSGSSLSTTSAEQSVMVQDPVNVSLIISEVTDPNDTANAKYVEIYNNGTTTIDFTTVDVFLYRQSNGGPTDSSEKLTGNLAAGDFYVIAGNASTFSSSYGRTADLVTGTVNGNGDDVYALYVNGDEDNGTLLDIYGEIGVDGTGEAWQYENARAYRNNLNDTPSTTWTAASWTIQDPANVPDMTPGTGEAVVIDFTWDGMAWTPSSPEGVSTSNDNITLNADYNFTSATVNFNDLTIGSSAILTSNAGTVFNASGDINNTGLVILDDATIIVGGTTAQTIDGTDYEILNLTVNNPQGLIVDDSNAIEVLGEFALSNGAVSTTDGIILNYDINGSADLTYINGSINGTIVVERFVPVKTSSPVNSTYRFLAPALQTTQTIFEAWQENGASPSGFGTDITGSTTGANGFDPSPTGNPSLLTYDPDFDGAPGAGWQFATTTQVQLDVERGYNLFIRGDRNYNLGDPNASPTSTTLRVSGTPILGNKTMTASDLAGEFTLIANPYPATVDVADVLLNSSTNLDPNVFYSWDPNIGDQGDFVEITAGVPTPSSSPATGVVESGHSFFVQTTATASASMTFTESSKSLTGATTTLGTNPYPTPGAIEITLISAATGNTMSAAAINKFVGLPDRLKFMGRNENLFITTAGEFWSQLNAEDVQDLSDLAIGVNNTTARDYVITITNLPSDVIILDTLTGTTINPSETVAGFTFTAMPQVDQSSRFVLTSTLGSPSVELDNLSVFPNPAIADNPVTITGFNDGDAMVNVSIVSLSGQQILKSEIQVNNRTAALPVQALPTGVYILHLETASGSQAIKLIME